MDGTTVATCPMFHSCEFWGTTMRAVPVLRADLETAVRQAAAQRDGELVVKSRGAEARIHFHHGSIAWLVAPGRPSALEAAFEAPLHEVRDEARAVIDESRRTRRPFDEVIHELGLVPAEVVTRRLRRWILEGFAEVRSWEVPELTFHPGRRDFHGRHMVSVEELLVERASGTQPVAATVPPPARACAKSVNCHGCGADVMRTVQSLLDLDAVLGAVVVDPATGRILGRGGVRLDPAVLGAQLNLIRSLPPDELPGEIVLTSATNLHLTHTTACGSAVVSVQAQRAGAPLALLRVSVGKAARAILPQAR